MGEVDIERQAPDVKRMQLLGNKVRPATSGSKTSKMPPMKPCATGYS